jgi:hypothetical protein
MLAKFRAVMSDSTFGIVQGLMSSIKSFQNLRITP